MKKYALIDLNMIIADSNTRSDIEIEKEEIIENMIDEDKSISGVNIYQRIEKGEETEYSKVLLLKPNGRLPLISHDEYDPDIVLEKDEEWFGLVG